MKQVPLLYFIFVLSLANSFAQKQSVSVDTVYIQTLSDSCKMLKDNDPKNALSIGQNLLALIELSLPNANSKTKTFLKTAKANTLRNVGSAYNNLSDLPNALEYYKMSLTTAREVNNKVSIGGALLNTGIVYRELNDNEKALNFFDESTKIFEEIGNKRGLAFAHNAIGLMYSTMNQDSLALLHYKEGINYYNEIGDKQNEGVALNNIAHIYETQHRYDEALDNYESSLKMFEALGDSADMAISMAGIGNYYFNFKKNLDKAEPYYVQTLALSKKFNDLGVETSVLDALKDLYKQQGRYKEAFETYNQFVIARDSLSKKQNAEAIARKAMQTDFDEKQAKLQAEKEKQAAVAEEQSKRQQLIIWSVAGGLLLVAVFSVFMFNRWRVTQKQKKIIEVQKDEVEKSKHIIEEKNKDITDSITYAKRIQQAKLPKKEDIYSALPNCFVLFKPKDIVSGDFYFFHKNNQSIFIAAADCTGHGVPGAFMSMICSDKLEEAVSQSLDTSEILSLLNKGVKASLKQSEEDEKSTRDGMDIALCSVDIENRIVKYAGANRPFWIIRNGQIIVEEIKATKKAIGGFTEDNQHFDTHEIKLQHGDTFYLSSDGYADTFSGQDKKLTTKKFKEVLLNIQEKTMQEQEKHLDDFIENWKAGVEQVDDILVIGVRL